MAADHLNRLRVPFEGMPGGRSFGLRQHWPLLTSEALWGPEVCAEGLLGMTATAGVEEPPPVASFDFWYSVGKSGFRRLHRKEGCWVNAEKDCREAFGTNTLEDLQVDARCRLCWPLDGPAKEDAAEVTTGSESSSSGSETSAGVSGEALTTLLADDSD